MACRAKTTGIISILARITTQKATIKKSYMTEAIGRERAWRGWGVHTSVAYGGTIGELTDDRITTSFKEQIPNKQNAFSSNSYKLLLIYT